MINDSSAEEIDSCECETERTVDKWCSMHLLRRRVVDGTAEWLTEKPNDKLKVCNTSPSISSYSVWPFQIPARSFQTLASGKLRTVTSDEASLWKPFSARWARFFRKLHVGSTRATVYVWFPPEMEIPTIRNGVIQFLREENEALARLQFGSALSCAGLGTYSCHHLLGRENQAKMDFLTFLGWKLL